MRFFKLIQNYSVIAIGTGPGGTEITEGEYNELLAMIREKAALVDRVYNGEIGMDDVPAEWQEEIRRRVDERVAAEGTLGEQELSAEEAIDIILGGETV